MVCLWLGSGRRVLGCVCGEVCNGFLPRVHCASAYKFACLRASILHVAAVSHPAHYKNRQAGLRILSRLSTQGHSGIAAGCNQSCDEHLPSAAESTLLVTASSTRMHCLGRGRHAANSLSPQPITGAASRGKEGCRLLAAGPPSSPFLEMRCHAPPATKNWVWSRKEEKLLSAITTVLRNSGYTAHACTAHTQHSTQHTQAAGVLQCSPFCHPTEDSQYTCTHQHHAAGCA